MPMFQSSQPPVVELKLTDSTRIIADDVASIDFVNDECDPMARTQRFVAGQAFFNYDAGGSLREHLTPVSLFSRSHIGLAIAALWGGFFFAFTRYQLFPILSMHLGYEALNENNALTTLMAIPTGIAIVVGMITDKFPVFGYRRKPYMVLGFVMTGVLMAASAALYYFGDIHNKVVRFLLIFLGMNITLAGLFGMMPTYALTLEYAQRESLHRRGELQSTVFVLTFLAQAITGATCPLNIKNQALTGNLESSALNFGQLSIILAIGAFATSAGVIFYLKEDLAPALAKSSLQFGFLELWTMFKQTVFAGILIGLCGMQFFSFGVDQNIEMARMLWSGVKPSSQQSVRGAQLIAEFFGVIVGRAFFVNANWRTVGMIGTMMCFVAWLAGTVPVCYEVLTNKVWYYLCTCVTSIPQGWITVLVQLIATEVTKPGQEGSVVGLLLSIYFLFTLASLSVWDKLSALVVDQMTPLEIFLGTHETRMHIFRRALVFAAVHLVGFITITVLPTQKLDAQQRLAFGGSNIHVRLGVVGTYLAVLLYDIIANVYELV